MFPPLLDEDLRFAEAVGDDRVEQFIAEMAIEALAAAILPLPGGASPRSDRPGSPSTNGCASTITSARITRLACEHPFRKCEQGNPESVAPTMGAGQDRGDARGAQYIPVSGIELGAYASGRSRRDILELSCAKADFGERLRFIAQYSSYGS